MWQHYLLSRCRSVDRDGVDGEGVVLVLVMLREQLTNEAAPGIQREKKESCKVRKGIPLIYSGSIWHGLGETLLLLPLFTFRLKLIFCV